MKIFIICSKSFYGQIPEIKKKLENKGHIITLPNCFDNPLEEFKYKDMGFEEHAKWKAGKIKYSEKVVSKQDAVLVLNFKKHGVPNYIGGATFLEMYEAFKLGKKIYMFNDIPDGILKDEINSFSPVLINADLNRIA